MQRARDEAHCQSDDLKEQLEIARQEWEDHHSKLTQQLQ